MADSAELAHRFKYHAPSPSTQMLHAGVRVAVHRVADKFNEQLPEGREKSLALTKLEEAMFWANAALARANAE